MGGGEVLKKGLLIKSPPLDSGALKMWRRRWFVLLSSKVLEYYKSDGGEQKGVINLEDCHSVNCNLSHKRYKHVFNIETKERVYFLVAQSQSEMEAWVNALCRVCELQTDNTCVVHTLPASSSSKSKGPNITQPIYSTSTLGNPYGSSGHLGNPTDSVYSLAMASPDYGVRGKHMRQSAGVPAGVSEAVSSRGLGSNRASAASGVSGGDIAGNRLSETALFSPRLGNTLGFLAEADPPSQNSSSGRCGVSPGHHRAVSKARPATLAPSALPSGLEHRSQTNAAMYGGAHPQPQVRSQLLSSDCMPASLDMPAVPSSSGLPQLQESPFDMLPPALEDDSAALEEGYGLLHMPPPIDRSTKPSAPQPPAVDRALKPSRQKADRESSGSSKEASPEPGERRWSLHDDSPPYIKLSDGTASEGCGHERGKDENHETQFHISEMPQVTVRTTHYTQVDFDPDRRRPVPLPRKTSTLSTIKPKPRRINYADVDIQATNQLSDHLHRQMTVREAERRALAEKHYINVDHSGQVDDETDPDYYTHMRDFTFDEADKPDYKSYCNQKLQAQDNNVHTVEQEEKDDGTF